MARPKRYSIRRQLLLLTLIVLLVVNGIVVWTSSLYASRAARLSFDRLLIGSALQIAENINMLNQKVVIDLPRSAFETLAMAPEDRAFYSILGPDLHVLTGYTNLPEIPLDALEKVRLEKDSFTPYFYNVPFSGEEVRFLVMVKQLIDAERSIDVFIVVGQTLQARNELAEEMNWLVFQFLLLIFSVTLLLMMFGIWRVLRPLQWLKRELDTRSPMDLRPLSSQVPKEISPLVSAINQSMVRQRSTLERLKRFSAEAAHQIRTPLAGLSSQAQNAYEEQDESLRQQQLLHIVESSGLLTETVNHILNQARLTHRFQSEPLQRISLTQLTKDVCREVVVSALQKNVEIEYQGELDIRVQGDDFALKQMIRNVIENAVKYSPPQSVVEVSLEACPNESMVAAVLQVRDHGMGVSDSDKEHIFERYFRASDNVHPGTGMGLAIAKEVAEHHHASFRLKDNDPQGLIVEVVFPSVENDRG